MDILDFTFLDSCDGLVQPGAGRAHLSVREIAEYFLYGLLLKHILHVNVGHRGDDHSSSAASGFLELREFLKPDRTFLHPHAEIEGDFLKRLVGNRRQHAV